MSFINPKTPKEFLTTLAKPIGTSLDELVHNQELALMARATKQHFSEYLRFTQFFYDLLNACDRDYCMANCPSPCHRQNQYSMERISLEEDDEKKMVCVEAIMPHRSQLDRLSKKTKLYIKQEGELVKVTLGSTEPGFIWQYEYGVADITSLRSK